MFNENVFVTITKNFDNSLEIFLRIFERKNKLEIIIQLRRNPRNVHPETTTNNSRLRI